MPYSFALPDMLPPLSPLPARPPLAPHAPVQDAAVQIFIVEDDAAQGQLMAMALADLGTPVQVFTTAAPMLEALSRGTCPVLLLLDIHLPGTDGIDTVAQLQGIPRPLHLRLVTGGDVAHAMAASMTARARDVPIGRTLYKPMKLQDLRDIVTCEIARLSARPTAPLPGPARPT